MAELILQNHSKSGGSYDDNFVLGSLKEEVSRSFQELVANYRNL